MLKTKNRRILKKWITFLSVLLKGGDRVKEIIDVIALEKKIEERAAAERAIGGKKSQKP